jgi:uncharacterized protein YdcH (DUF465 family)
MNAADTQDIKTLLETSHEGYRELFQQHHRLDDRLHELAEKHYLTDDEQLEETTLKKRKLALKDQMEQMAREYVLSRGAQS